MPTYKYKALTPDGTIIKGKMQAANDFDIEALIEQSNNELISFKKIKFQKKLFAKKIPRKELINFTLNLEQMIKSGVPLLEALQDIRDTVENKAFRDILISICELIQNGKTFSESLSEFSYLFDNVYISLVKIGEQSGELNKVLKDLSEALKWMDELVSHSKKIMIYPAIVFTVIISVLSFLMIYLVPKLIPFIEGMGDELPLQTRILIMMSDFFVNHWEFILATPFVVFFIFSYITKKSKTLSLIIDKLKLKIPIIGNILLKIKISRFTRYFALMYDAGITVLESLNNCKSLVDNKILSQSIEKAHAHISNGHTISESFKEAGLFPPLVIRMIRVGEKTGGLDESLHSVSYFYDREVNEMISKLEPILEPILTILMGGMMMWVMISILGPVYNVMTRI